MVFVFPNAISTSWKKFSEHKLTEKDSRRYLQPQVKQQQISTFLLNIADIQVETFSKFDTLQLKYSSC